MHIRSRIKLLTAVTLLGINMISLPVLASSNIDTLKSAYEQQPSNTKAAHEYAVALARSGQYPPALAILNKLTAETTDPYILYDYITILSWAGEYQSATNLYDKIDKTSVPPYVKINIARAYYQLGQFKTAQILYHQAAAEDKLSKRYEAECYMRLNDITTANKLYTELLAENPNDADAYLSRASMYIILNDTISAAEDINKALTLADQSKAYQIRADFAPLFIQKSDYNQAIILLKPLIDNHQASIKMQGNYLLALRLNGAYQEGIKTANKLWLSYTNIPDFALQALGDCYLKTSHPQEAIKLYQLILTRNNQDTNLHIIKLSLGYAQLLTHDLTSGLTTYDQILTLNPSYADIASGDAAALITQGHFETGKALFNLLSNKYPENKNYRLQYAAALTANNMPRDAYDQYHALSFLKNSQPAAAAGMVNTAITIGDYQAATKELQVLNGYSQHPAAGQALNKFENRPIGSTDFTYTNQQDYKGKKQNITELTASQHLGGNYTLLSGLTSTKLTDDTSVHFNNYSLGLAYNSYAQDAKLWLDNYHTNNSFSGYRLETNHYFGDQAVLGLELSHKPVEDPEALTLNIMTTDQRLVYNRQLGLKDSYSLGITNSNFSDGNNSFGFDGFFDHKIIDSASQNTSYFSYANHTSYKYQTINNTDTPYDSPSVREAYGFGYKNTLFGTKDYLTSSFSLEWSHDLPDPFSFSPHLSLEYGFKFNSASHLTTGFEYGLRTNSTESGLHFNYRNYTVNYLHSW